MPARQNKYAKGWNQTGAEEAEIAVRHGADIIDLKDAGSAKCRHAGRAVLGKGRCGLPLADSVDGCGWLWPAFCSA
jgi:hypothetical protein